MVYNITIDGEISPWGFSKSWMAGALASFKDKHVDMKVSSLGGSVDHALDMRQQLIDHGDVTAYLTGFVASAATIVTMGAKKICMSKYAMFLVHKCSNFIDVFGRYNADEIDALIKELEANKRDNDKIDVVIASIYAYRCHKSIEDLMDVLKKGGWLTAQEALDLGFIDEITEEEGDKINFTPELEYKFNAIGLPTDGLKDTRQSRSIISQIFEMVKSLVATRNDDRQEDADAAASAPSASISPVALCSALSVERLTATADGSVTLDAAQVDRIEEALASLNADIAARDASIAQLNERIATLNQLPGDTTGSVKDDTSNAEMSTAEMYKLSKIFLDL